MAHRIGVDVAAQMAQIFVGRDGNRRVPILEKRAGTVVAVVERLAVCIEHTLRQQACLGLAILPHQPVIVIGQQAIGDHRQVQRRQVPIEQFQGEPVILLVEKDRTPPRAAVVDMIVAAWLKLNSPAWHMPCSFSHGCGESWPVRPRHGPPPILQYTYLHGPCRGRNAAIRGFDKDILRLAGQGRVRHVVPARTPEGEAGRGIRYRQVRYCFRRRGL